MNAQGTHQPATHCYKSCLLSSRKMVRRPCAAANAWHAELSDLSEDCVNGVTAMQVQPFVGDTALYPLLVLLQACSWATDMPLVFYTDIFHALVGSILHKELFVQLRPVEDKEPVLGCRNGQHWARQVPSHGAASASNEEGPQSQPFFCSGRCQS